MSAHTKSAEISGAPEVDKVARRDRSSDGPRRRRGRGEGGNTINLFSQGFLVLWTLMAALPLLWAFMTAFKSSADILNSPWSFPDSLEFGNFSRAWEKANIGRYFFNSLVVVGGSLIGTMALGSMTAYVLARFTFPGNRLIYFMFIGGMSFPVIMALVPLFFVLKNMNLLSTPQGLILVYIAYSLPFTVFFLTAFFRTLPTSVAEAAMVDGASHSRTFFQVMLPMAKPGMISVGIFNFLGQWNQYLLPQVLSPEPKKFVLPQGLAALSAQQGYRGDWGGLFAGLTMATIPVLMFYIIFQRQVQAGLTAGAIK